MHLVLLLPDGIGVRHFLYTDFVDTLLSRGHQITVWADQPVLDGIQDDRLKTCALPQKTAATRWMEVYRMAWQTAQLQWQAHAQNDKTYLLYAPKKPKTGLKRLLKWYVSRWLAWGKKTPKAVLSLRDTYYQLSQKTAYYRACLDVVAQLQPDIVFCSHQRASRAVGPLLAAKTQHIPTACFIFSWDNLPKATLLAPSDHYFLWSEHMRAELQLYHPEIAQSRQHVVGTPQFQPYFDTRHSSDRQQFCQTFGIDPAKILLCFTGDDRTTSPHDPVYLQHLAAAVTRLNAVHHDVYRILFRRCPVDWSDRYADVLQQYPDLIHVVEPRWLAPAGSESWQHIMPTREDVTLLVQTVQHASLTINIGSTTALDFAVLGKPACYLRYHAVKTTNWDVFKVYQYVHFRSMNGLNPVYWINHADEMEQVLVLALQDVEKRVTQAQEWHRRIACHPLEAASSRFAIALEHIAACTSAT